MECMFEAYYLNNELESLSPNDIPQTEDPVWILGGKFNAIQELELIRREVQSLLWFTYRKGFVPIGSPGLTTDKGWGCMLRCGQMALAQALVKLHLGPEWFWTPETRDVTYLKIVNRFEERRQAPFSIHQIALMGASEGKEVGEWFGPNTVAQVLKKLVVYDAWSSLVIHVALDNMVFRPEILDLCRTQESTDNDSEKSWKPLLLIIPLRLGLNEINPIYVNGLKTCFELPQSLGVIGGRPNQALYLIGYVGDDVLFLDPHTTQRAGNIDDKSTAEQMEMDATYHCKYANRIPILNMDPSVAVCFLCRTEVEFTELCQTILSRVMQQESQPLFELCDSKPEPWAVANDVLDESLGAAAVLCGEEWNHLDRKYDSEDEFELLG